MPCKRKAGGYKLYHSTYLHLCLKKKNGRIPKKLVTRIGVRSRMHGDKSGSEDFQQVCLYIVCIVSALQQKSRRHLQLTKCMDGAAHGEELQASR